MKTFRSAYVFVMIAMFWLGSSSVWSQQAKNVVLADFISTEQLYNRSTPFPYNDQFALPSIADIWGWTYNGNEYALICLGSQQEPNSGLVLVKVTDPNAVQIIKTIKRNPPQGDPVENGPYDVKTFIKSANQQYAYICQNNDKNYYVNLIQALDNPGDPFAGVIDFIAGSRIHNLQVCTGNATLFLSDLFPGNPILVYNINNITPSSLASISLPAGPPPSQNRRSHDLYVTGSRIYSASNDQGITIFDYSYNIGGSFSVTATRNHFYNARRDQSPDYFLSSPLVPISHNVWPSSNGNYLFATDERNGDDVSEGSPTRQLGPYLRTWNISTIDTPPNGNGYRYPISKVYQAREINEPAGSFNSTNFTALPAGEFGNSIHNVHIRNENGIDVAYVTYYTKGLRILDVANPSSPTELGWYDVPNVANYYFPVYAGSWGVYPYFSSNTIVVSDAGGLYVFRRATEKSGTISSNQTWSGAIFVTNNITVSGSNTTLTISPGTTVAFADGKSLTVNAGAKIIADGTSTQTIKFTSNSHPPARSKWGGITLYSTGNVFDYCTFEYGGQTLRAVNAGATVSNSTFHTCYQPLRLETSNVYLSNCDVSNSFAGITLVGQSGNNNSVTIYNCHAWKNDRDGITATNFAQAVIKNSHFELNGTSHTSNYHGVYASNNCNLTFYDPELLPTSGLNTIRNNEGAGVYSSNSTISIGLGTGSNKRGDQAIFGNGIYSGTYSGKQIYNAAGATIYAQWTYWGAGQCPPPASFFFGSVDRANCLTTSPTGFSKIMAGSDSTTDAKTLITQLKGYLLDQSGVPVGFDSLSTYDAVALYFSMIRNDFNDVLQERAQVESVLQSVYDAHKGSVVGDKAFQFLVGYKMIYVD